MPTANLEYYQTIELQTARLIARHAAIDMPAVRVDYFVKPRN